MFNQCSTTFDLDRHLIPFLQDVPFFAEISRHLRKMPTRDMPTAAVTFEPHSEEMSLFYNPDFVEPLGNWQIRGLLNHEFYHLIFGHLQFRRRTPPRLWNVATDLAINSLIMSNARTNGTPRALSSDRHDGPLPECALIPGRWPQHPEGREFSKEEKEGMQLAQIISTLPELKSSEWYFNEIIKQAQQLYKDGKLKPGKGQGGMSIPGLGDPGDGSGEPGEGKGGGSGNPLDDLFNGSGIDSMDDHSPWDDIPDDQRELVEGKVRSIIEKAVRHADQHSNGWGNIPSELRQDIRRSISHIVNWRNVLRQFVGTITRGHRRTSIKRINTRYPYIHPGVKRGYVAKLLIAIDMSGSVDNEMLALFFSELGSLTKKVEIDILPFDCHADVKEIYTWRRGTIIEAKRTRSGGTDFNAPTRVVNDPKNRGRWDGMLIMTDGECNAPVPSRVRRGWILGKGQKLMFPSTELQIMLDDGKQLKGAWR
jgi:predicted metal-dependent peptidase